LDVLTVKYTDIYLRRVYGLLQNDLYPDSTIFLGDLFDGGREWSTSQSVSPEQRYRKYGEGFWIREYKRFSSIFFDIWMKAGITQQDGAGRRQLLSNLPGNHDLGFASGIQKPVRNRFNTYFGDGSRIDIIGNHTFVSLDTVSLSAKDDEGSDHEIWRPAQEFLDGYRGTLSKTISDHVSRITGDRKTPGYRHNVVEGDALVSASLPTPPPQKLNMFPSILLTHVPIYRDQGTPCGPWREHWPPTLDSNGKPLEVDDRNSITVARGYQYQNVLSLEISKEVTSKLGGLSYAFSGDDHDFCYVHHRQYPSAGGGIREITVKSISWAMGVRKPGFQLLSLWNPVDYSQSSDISNSQNTLQTELCLLPDQLGIFIGYAKLLVLTFIIIFCRAAYLAFNPSQSPLNFKLQPLLPTTRSSAETEKCESSSSSSDDSNAGPSARSRLMVRLTTDRPRSASPRTSTGYGLPASNGATKAYKTSAVSRVIKSSLRKSLDADDEFSLWGTLPAEGRQLKGITLFWAEFKGSIIKVACIVLPWYAWLIWNW
jgi:ethanolamine phosphate phosphodiesterase